MNVARLDRIKRSMRGRLLVAVPESVFGRFARALPEHELVLGSTVEDAARSLSQGGFDLLILGYQFDDSRALELLLQASHPATPLPPVLCLIGERLLRELIEEYLRRCLPSR